MLRRRPAAATSPGTPPPPPPFANQQYARMVTTASLQRGLDALAVRYLSPRAADWLLKDAVKSAGRKLARMSAYDAFPKVRFARCPGLMPAGGEALPCCSRR
jgi:hypothetical protein